MVRFGRTLIRRVGTMRKKHESKEEQQLSQ